MAQSKEFLLFCVFALVLCTFSTDSEEIGYYCRPVEITECESGYKLTLEGADLDSESCVKETTCKTMQQFKIYMELCDKDDDGNSCEEGVCMKVLEYGGCSKFECQNVTSDTPFVYDCEKNCSECAAPLSCVYSKIGTGDRVFDKCAEKCDYETFLSGTFIQCPAYLDCSCCQKDGKTEKKVCMYEDSPYFEYKMFLSEKQFSVYVTILLGFVLGFVALK